jgi:hypothetical protein
MGSVQLRLDAFQKQLDSIETESREFRGLVSRNLPLLRNVSDRAVARAEAEAFHRSLRRQMRELSHGVGAMRKAKAARLRARQAGRKSAGR